MGKGHEFDELAGIASLLFAVVLALVAFAWGSQPGTTEAATDGAIMSLRVDAAQTVACPGGSVPGKVCVLGGLKFDVIVVADAIPASGYIFAQAWIDYDDQGLVSKDNTQALWPDHEPITFVTIDDVANHGAQGGALTGISQPQPASFHKGDLFSFSLTCTRANSTSDIELVPANPHTANTAGSRFTEATGAQIIPEVSGITVNCVTPPPAMSLRVDAAQTVACPGGPVPGEVCVLGGLQFDVIVVADAIPALGYILAQGWIDYDDQGLVSKDNVQALWPDHEPLTFLTINDAAHHGAQAGALTGLFPPDPLPASFHKGDLFSFSLTCTQANSTSDIELVPANPHTANTAGSRFTEATGAQIIPEVNGITVNCVTPPPKPVGGMAVDHELRALPLETSHQSGPSIGVLAGIAAALGLGAVLGVGAAGHVRRRFSRA